jgi:DNA-binding beta-propeller fold protein YncE
LDSVVIVIDGATNTVTGTIALQDAPVGLSVNPEVGRLYTVSATESTLSIIDLSTNMVTSTLFVGGESGSVAVSPETGLVYVTNDLANTVTVIEDGGDEEDENDD